MHGRLHQYLAQTPVLQALYFAKQQWNGFLVMKSLKAKRAKQLLRNFENYRMRVLAQCGWNGVISRV